MIRATSPLPDPTLIAALQRGGLLADPATAQFQPLSGGVSSDIWLVEADGRRVCVKRALSRLKVASEWLAPVERNRYEVEWLRLVREIEPRAVPRILFSDETLMLCAMEYLEPQAYPLWKAELREGRVDCAAAAEVGRRLARIHAATAGRPDMQAKFPRADIFHAIRLEPYLEATAQRHPDLREALFGLSRRTGATRLAMIHGDVSPKNILLGPEGPVFLDAECACVGDPAFDLAFCLNHLLLKCLWNPAARDGFLDAFAALSSAYLGQVAWEAEAELEFRAASLLPALFLARVDGKSPVEYLRDEIDKECVRRCARPLVASPPRKLADVLAAWRSTLQ